MVVCRITSPSLGVELCLRRKLNRTREWVGHRACMCKASLSKDDEGSSGLLTDDWNSWSLESRVAGHQAAEVGGDHLYEAVWTSE